MQILPKTKLGRLSLGLIIAMPFLFFIGTNLTNTLYESVPAGNSIPEDIMARPALALSMLAGIIAGVFAFFAGIIAIKKYQERSLLAYASTLVGFLLIIFLLGEILFPH